MRDRLCALEAGTCQVAVRGARLRPFGAIMERKTRFELATTTLARKNTTFGRVSYVAVGQRIAKAGN